MFPRFLSPRPPFFFVPFVLKGERGKGGGLCAEVRGEEEWVPIL
jgi:hypothetical protein